MKVPDADSGGLYYLVHGEILDSFYELKIDYEKVMLFYEMAEVILKGNIDNDHLPHAYRLFKSVLNLTEPGVFKFRLAISHFKYRMLLLLGVMPVVDHCVSCGVTERIVTPSIQRGGLVCESCYDHEEILLSSYMIPLWRILFKANLQQLLSVPINETELEFLEIWIASYYENYTGIRFAKRL